MPSTTTLPSTRFEQIAAAFPLHAQRIAECVSAQHGPVILGRFLSGQSDEFNLKYGTSEVLRGAFAWDMTTEGHSYWSALAAGART